MGRMKHDHHETITRGLKGFNHAAEEHAAKEKMRLEKLANDEMMQQSLRIQERAAEIRKPLLENGMPLIQAIVMSNDAAHAEYLTEAMLKEGRAALDMVWYVGSYARFAWAQKHLGKEDFFDLLPTLWTGSDPCDSVEHLDLWKEAYKRNGGIVCDGAPLEAREYTIYRGQTSEELGISWTLRFNIATIFARGASHRAPTPDGRIIRATIGSDKILAYLTERGEYEVIVDPKDVRIK